MTAVHWDDSMHKFVADGEVRLRKACLEKAEAEMLAAYGEQLKAASVFERRRMLRRLREQLRSEIEARANEIMPKISGYTLW